MSRNKKTVPPSANDEASSSIFEPYNEEKTKEIVGNLFDEFAEDGGINYFSDYSDPFLDAEQEDEESLQESISRRRRRSITTSNKSIVFRKKAKKIKPEEEEASDIEQEDEDIREDAVHNGADLEKTIILPKLSSFFKKSEDEGEDDEIDEFFADLTKQSRERNKAAAAAEPQQVDIIERASEGEAIEDEQEEPASKPKNRNKNKSKSRSKNNKPDNGQEEGPKQPETEAEPEEEPVERRPRRRAAAPPEPTAADEDEADEYEEKFVEISVFRIGAIGLLVIAAVVITALAYKNHSYSKQLEEARGQITELQKSSSSTYETELNELKARVDELTAENESLKAGSETQSDPHAAAIEILNEAQSEIATDAPSDTNLSQGESGGNTYTVKSGDTFWKISQSVYGNGASYKKILDANNLTENSVLNEGQVLTIPN